MNNTAVIAAVLFGGGALLTALITAFFGIARDLHRLANATEDIVKALDEHTSIMHDNHMLASETWRDSLGRVLTHIEEGD